MESRIIKTKALLLFFSLLFFLSSGKTASAQEKPNRFLLSVSEYYSPKTNSSTFEIGVGYLFNKVGISLKYGRLGLPNDRMAHEEIISVFVPSFKIHSFSMIPEVAAGIIHGGTSTAENNTSIIGQIQIGVVVNYRIMNNMSCGITCKSVHYNAGAIPLLGLNYSLLF